MGCASAMGGWQTWLLLGGAALLFVAMFFFSARRRKKEEEAYKEKMESLVPGVKILTIGGIIGEIVEVADGYVVIVTGSEENKSYMAIDKRGISGPITENKAEEQQPQETQEEVEESTQETQEEVVLSQGELEEETEDKQYTQE